jgi:uncharacterized LabA/DUF88 family protein
MDRVCLFIDGSGFYFSLKRNNHATRVDYHELSKALVGPDRKLIRAYYYNSAYDPALSPDQWKTQQSFLDSLTRTPFLELRLGKLIPQKEGGFREKGTDIRLVSDMVYYAAKDIYDTAIVITENTDFAGALAQVKEFGKHIELCFFPEGQPRELVQVADRIIPLVEVLTKFGKKIFPEAPENMETPEDNAGNRVGDPIPTKSSFLSGPKGLLKGKKKI